MPIPCLSRRASFVRPTARAAATLALPALLAVAGPADARRAKPPAGPTIQRCVMELTMPDGEALWLSGWGPDQAEARDQVERIARLTAELHAQPEVWMALLHPAASERAAFGERLAAVPAGDGDVEAGGGALFPVPGYGTGAPVCGAVPLPEPTGARAWSAVWGDGGARVERTDPATAIEASRRRSCVVPYQDALRAMWDGLAAGESGDIQARFRATYRTAADGAVACLAEAGEPALAPVADAPPVVGVDAALVECGAREIGPLAGRSQARAWGPSPEWAAEVALGTLLYAVHRDAFARTADALDHAPPEDRPRLVADQARRLTAIVPRVPDVEPLQLSCVARPEADGAVELRWQPLRHDVLATCEPPAGWGDAIEARGAAGETPFALQQRLQRRLVHPVLATVRAAWEAEGRDPAMAIRGRGLVALCEASSLDAITLVGFGTAPLPAGEGPDRGTPEASRAALDRALAERDLAALLAVVHPARRGDLLGQFERAGRGPDGAGAFWAEIAETIPAALDAGQLQWTSAPEGWLLTQAAP